MKMDNPNLFGEDDGWRYEWQNMPEFIQEDLTSYKKVIVHFRDEHDFNAFQELIGQKLKKNGMATSCWFPEQQPRRYAHLRYIDEP